MRTADRAMLARLRPLPLRLRIAHLAALRRCGKVTMMEEISHPNRQERKRREGSTTDGSRAG
jgi:hypothetical protein